MSRSITLVINGLISITLMLSSAFVALYLWGYWPDMNEMRSALPSGIITMLAVVIAAVFSLGASIAWQTFSYYRNY